CAKRRAGAAQLLDAVSRATSYAYEHGVTVVVSAGRSGLDMDNPANIVAVPAMSPHVLAVTATGPVGFAVNYPNGATNFTRHASYSNFGQSIADFAAPGGDNVYTPTSQICSIPRIPPGSVTTACSCFALVFCPGSITA